MRALLAVTRHELSRIFVLKPVFSVLILASALYTIFYPQPYLAEALRDVPVAVVDLDGTDSSRTFARLVDATPDIAVALVLPDLPSAQAEVFGRKVYGILVVPRHFERDLLHGRASPVALYSDASYFLINSRISGAVTAVARALGANVEISRLVAGGVDPALAGAAADPMPLTAVPLFNPQGGYATYVLPAAFVLLLQQTLLIGVALLGTLPDPDQPTRESAATTEIAGKLVAYLIVEAAILPLYLIVLPYLYGVPRLGSSLSILVVAVPFVLAVGGLGLVLARLFREPLTVQLVTAAIGLPFFFTAGFAWPSEAMPATIRAFALAIPSTAAIDAFVRVSQLGASLAEARGAILTLWALAAVYSCTAVWLTRAARGRQVADLPASFGRL